MEIDYDKLCEHYKELQTFCYENGEAMPDLLKQAHIPLEYKLTDKEFKKLDIKKSDVLAEKTKKQREKQYNLLFDKKSKLEDYLNKELENFMNKHSQFKKILVE